MKMKTHYLIFLFCISAFAQKARAQNFDTCIYITCKEEVNMLQVFGPLPYPEKIDTDVVEIQTLPCFRLNLVQPRSFNGLCAQGNFSISNGNSCNFETVPKASCVAQDSSTKGANLYFETKHKTILSNFMVNYVLPIKNTQSYPQNQPNLPKQLVAKLLDANGNVLARKAVNLITSYPKDTSWWINFDFDIHLDPNKSFNLLVFGRDPLYTNNPQNVPLWDFYGFKAEFLCSARGQFCDWGVPKKIAEYRGCPKEQFYRWISSCGDTTTIKFVITDREAPVVLQKPQDVTRYVSAYNCELEYYVPAIVFDDCDKNATVLITSPFGNIQNNGGYLAGIRQGKWLITYVITDACGNTTTCTYYLTVKENNNFTLICKQNLVISLNAPCVKIPAKTFVGGVVDLCCPSYIVKAMRMDNTKGGLQKDVEFCCADVGKDIMVMITVYSECDTTILNSCMVNVQVQDKRLPQITCPPDVTVSCDTFSIDELAKYGKAIATANCGVSVKDTFVSTLDDCKIGKVVRIFTATGLNGLTAMCSQTITVLNTNPITALDIIWPRDTTLYECHTMYDKSRTGEPSVSRSYKGCSKALYSHSDQVFFAGGNGICKKILRTWKAIDCCYPYNKPWEKLQIITLRDSIKPIITYCPTDTSMPNFGACTDSVQVNLKPVTATDCGGILRISNNSKYATNSGADASGRYPNGVHKVTFTVYDSCGNSSTCFVNITVSDKKPPTFFCHSIITELQDMPGMGITQRVDVNLLVLKKEDNCCPSDRITVSFSRDTLITTLWFTCKDIGENVVELWFTDCNGNKDLCKPKIIIQDNNNLCPTFRKDTMYINGFIRKKNGTPINQVNVFLNNMPMACDAFYEFDSLPEKTYEIYCEKDGDFAEGVTTADINLIRQYIFGVKNLSPYQLIAADVNNDGRITTADIVEIQKLILGKITKFPKNTSWRFVPKSYIFPDLENPWGYPEKIVLYLNRSMINQDFIGIKIGDVTGADNFAGDDDNAFLSSDEKEWLTELDAELMLEAGKASTKGLVLYPNPTTGKVRLDFPNESNADVKVRVIASNGKEVMMKVFLGGGDIDLDLENYKSGVYFISIRTDNNTHTRKILKH
ncbi:MAG: T9SS type A sorting domain-containing protein [bacterium]|nr:T9SS type A sorting domain-containing protein [bacterium]